MSGAQLRHHHLTYGTFLDEATVRALGSTHPLLDIPRFVSPSLHYAISTALSNYAVKVVRYVIERRYGGKLVYAGGDDVKALLPVEDVLPVMHELQVLYRGLTYEDTLISPPIRSGGGFVEIPEEGVCMVMGAKATTSVGTAIVHHSHPLAHAIEQAGEALKQGGKRARH